MMFVVSRPSAIMPRMDGAPGRFAEVWSACGPTEVLACGATYRQFFVVERIRPPVRMRSRAKVRVETERLEQKPAN